VGDSLLGQDAVVRVAGLQLFLSRIEPTDQVGHEERTYECLMCAYEETVTVKFR
jgi:hypothetical protein